MTSVSSRALAISMMALLIALSTIGCGGRPAAAQRLFDKGQYQAVIDKYPELEIARRAKAKLAQELVDKKDYATVLSQYSDTPAAFQARTAIAQQLFDQGRYRALIDSFPHSQLATMAKERLADSLFAAGQLDDLVRLYPDTPKGKQVKEDKAKADLAAAKKLRGAAQKQALEDFMAKYGGTESYKEAGEMLSKIRNAEAAKAGKQ